MVNRGIQILRVSDFNFEKSKCLAMFNFRRILGPLVMGWAPNHFVLGAQLAPGEKRLVCIPVKSVAYFQSVKQFGSRSGPTFCCA